MISGGYLRFGAFTILEKAYLDGRYFEALNEEGSPFSAKPSDGCVLIPTHGGTTGVQVPFLGDSAPLIGKSFDFTCGFSADNEDDYKALQIAASKGRPLDYAPGLWATETFTAFSGVACTLSRRSADSVLAPVDGISYAPEFYAGGGDNDPSLGSVTGSVFMPAATGEISVRYMGVYQVMVLGLSEDLSQVNDLVVTFQLSECVQASF